LYHINVFILFLVVVIRPHRSPTYVGAACCYRQSSVVCQSVCRDRESCKNCYGCGLGWAQGTVYYFRI